MTQQDVDIVCASFAPGDLDRDGLILANFGELQRCWSGPFDEPTFVQPSAECVQLLDFDNDQDIDQADYVRWRLKPSVECP